MSFSDVGSSRVFQINTAVASFQRMVKSLGTARDSPELRDKLNKTRLQITQLVKDTSVKLKEAAESNHHAGPMEKMTHAKMSKDLQAVLKEFQKVQRLAAERETAYPPFNPQAVVPSYMSYTASGSDTTSDVIPNLDFVRKEAVRLGLLLTNERASYTAEENQEAQEIQQQISEINEICKNIALLADYHGVMTDDIESSYAATARAKSQLAKAAKSRKSYSFMVCLLLVIFAVILLIVVIVTASRLFLFARLVGSY